MSEGAKPYWAIWKLCNGERVWWDDVTEDWVDREEATEELTAVSGNIARDRARAHNVRIVPKDEPWAEAYREVRISKFSPKGYCDPKKLAKELEDAQRESRTFDAAMVARFKALTEILTNPKAVRVKANEPGYSPVYDLVWNLREAYITEQRMHAATMRELGIWKVTANTEQEHKLRARAAALDGTHSELEALLKERDQMILGLVGAMMKMHNDCYPVITQFNEWCVRNGLIHVKPAGTEAIA